jgi:hypothetical protein
MIYFLNNIKNLKILLHIINYLILLVIRHSRKLHDSMSTTY